MHAALSWSALGVPAAGTAPARAAAAAANAAMDELRARERERGE